MSEQVLNAWGEPVPDDSPEDNPYWVPEDQRLETDIGPRSNALGPDRNGQDTGDDLDGWQPGDPINDPLEQA